MIRLIKIVHTAVWVVQVAAILYVVYAGLTNTFNWILYLAIGLVLVESIVLVANRWTCPLTPVAMKYTEDRKDNFDIYLPEWLARHNKTIFTTIFLVGLLLVAVNIFAR